MKNLELPVDVFHFRWYVPDMGYLWDNNVIQIDSDHKLHKDEDNLAFLIENQDSKQIQSYLPITEVPELFLKFANLDTTQEKILDFANNYGLLGIGDKLVHKNNKTIIYGESLNVWHAAIWEMKILVNVWEWLEEKDAGKLGQVIIWSKDHKNVKFYKGKLEDVRNYLKAPTKFRKLHNGAGLSQKIIANNSIYPEIFALWSTGDVFGPAKLLLTLEINKKLKGLASPCLLLDRKGNPQGFIKPHNLLASMWFQFYQAVNGEKKYRRCDICQEFMDVTNCNSHKKMHEKCSNQKRVAKSRDRKIKTIQLYKTGKTVNEIAKIIRSNENQISKWIREANLKSKH